MIGIKDRESKKKLLGRYKRKKACLDALVARYEDMLGKAGPASPSLDGMPRGRGGTSDKVGDAAVRLAEMSDRIAAMRESCAGLRAETLGLIDSVDYAKGARVLEYHYVECLTMEDTAAEMRYSLRRTYEIYNKALDAMDVE